MTGLILAGGESKRAGTDKGLKLKDAVPWVCLMKEKLVNLVFEVKISVNQQQLGDYQKFFEPQELIIDEVELPGPLRGILTAHIKFPERDWLVLACDLLDLKEAAIRKIAESAKVHEGFDFYVYQNQEFYEPFCGVYTATGLSHILVAYQKKELKNYSMQQVFNTFQTFAVPVSMGDESFNNYNR